MNLNKVFVLGNLTKDPELRATPSGTAVCSFNVATNRHYTTAEGKKGQDPEFHTVVAWGKQAELVHQYLKKGSMLLVEGRLQTRDWQDDKGVKHWKTEIMAERLQLGPKMSKKSGHRTRSGNGHDDDGRSAGRRLACRALGVAVR